MRWSVYQIVITRGGNREAIGLGYVNAPHSPAALKRAWDKWPEKKDPAQVQAGFSVRVYSEDRMSLGKLHKG